MSKSESNRVLTYEFTGEQFRAMASTVSDLIKQRRQFTVAPIYPAGWTLSTPREIVIPPEPSPSCGWWPRQ